MTLSNCTSLYLDKHYIANNNLHWEPGESTSFTAYVDNYEEYATCDVTIYWKLSGQTVTAKSKTDIVGNTRFLSTLSHSEVLESVDPGVYNMKTLLYSDGLVTEEWWTNDDGSKVEIIIYDSNGNLPGDQSNIIVNDITFDESELIVGQTGTATVEFENTGSGSGEETFDIDVAEKGDTYTTQKNVTVSLGAGESRNVDVSITAGDTSQMTVRAGGQYGTIDVVQDPIQNESLYLSESVEEITAEYHATNRTSSEIAFDVEVTVTNLGSDSVVYNNTHEIVAGSYDRVNKTFNISVDVPSGETTDFEVCVKEI